MKIWRWTRTDKYGSVTIEVEALTAGEAMIAVAGIVWDTLGNTAQGNLEDLGPVPSEGGQ